jgi:cytosine/adenosine deaminase-related metal-dependent hydrolase
VTPLGGWDAVRAAVFHHNPEHRMSVRGAFLAATRGGWRAANVDDAGTLAPGMVATYAVWDTTSAQVAEARTDLSAQPPAGLRSGQPGLPDLSPGMPLPQCLRTVVRGRMVFER